MEGKKKTQGTAENLGLAALGAAKNSPSHPRDIPMPLHVAPVARPATGKYKAVVLQWFPGREWPTLFTECKA